MKLSIILAATVTADKFHKKEWEVQDAYFADQEVILSDPAIRQRFYNSKNVDFWPKIWRNYILLSFKQLQSAENVEMF